jgi:hypothetical protein
MPFQNPNSWFHLACVEDEGASYSIHLKCKLYSSLTQSPHGFLKLLSNWSYVFL